MVLGEKPKEEETKSASEETQKEENTEAKICNLMKTLPFIPLLYFKTLVK